MHRGHEDEVALFVLCLHGPHRFAGNTRLMFKHGLLFQFEDDSFDLVIEKSTLDTLLSDCAQEDGQHLEVVQRGLKEVSNFGL